MGDSSLSPLVTFVGRAKTAGIADDFIVSLLKNGGWSERRIFSAFSDYYENTLQTVIPSRGSRIEYARDAFFYLLAFFSLATWTCALGSVFYRLIDRWLPDALDSSRDAVYSMREISWQLAAVIVAFPLFLLITRALSIQVTKRPELLDSGVRKWLTNLALVIAAVVVVGDLVTFISSFLTGDLSTRFVWRVAVVLILAGGVFTYYLWALRDTVTPGVQRAFFAASLLAAGLGILGGFVATGPPAHQRSVALDEKRVSDVWAIVLTLHDQWMSASVRSAYRIPNSIAGLQSLPGREVTTTDPVTHEPYGYTALSATKYRLCVRFDQTNADVVTRENAFRHPADRYCYTFDAAQERGNTGPPYGRSF